jgi:hypothetical protein
MNKKVNIPKSDFSITIDYVKNSRKPSRVFETMSNLIKAFEVFDDSLVKHLDNKIETTILLEDIEIGSLRAWLANKLRGIPEEALKELDWKKAVGHYLNQGRYILLNVLEKKAQITSGDVEIIDLQLKEAAKTTRVNELPTYVQPTKKSIIENIKNISEATKPLVEGDTVFYEDNENKTSFNLELKIDVESLEDLITEEELQSDSTMILKVRKPDFLGNTKWSFKHGEQNIEASILHQDWLNKYQQGQEIIINPQDALVCRVRTTVKHDENNDVISKTYEILEVKEIRRAPNSTQTKISF